MRFGSLGQHRRHPRYHLRRRQLQHVSQFRDRSESRATQNFQITTDGFRPIVSSIENTPPGGRHTQRLVNLDEIKAARYAKCIYLLTASGV
ncbi:MAG: hypothetical protein DMG57_32560 [Acidobacteria bacterium]|nr:MAG: hypothetical protein DMG57_32560 [Acidobacteriota bacterium]